MMQLAPSKPQLAHSVAVRAGLASAASCASASAASRTMGAGLSVTCSMRSRLPSCSGVRSRAVLRAMAFPPAVLAWSGTVKIGASTSSKSSPNASPILTFKGKQTSASLRNSPMLKRTVSRTDCVGAMFGACLMCKNPPPRILKAPKLLAFAFSPLPIGTHCGLLVATCPPQSAFWCLRVWPRR